MKNTRRHFKVSASITSILLSLLFACAAFIPSAAQKGAPDPIRLLKAGNARYVSNRLRPRNYRRDRRRTADEQHPYAIVLTCADSRVPPEIIFDESLGRLFVARVAGNIVDPVMLGSIGMQSNTFMSIRSDSGHESCGAVKATLDSAARPLHTH